jgi:outer membrane lipoprotein carrier protein
MDCVNKSMRRVGVWAILACVGAPCLLGNSRETVTPVSPGFSSVWRHGFVPFALLSADPTEVLIHKVEQRYNKARTLTVDFVEDYSIQGRRRPSESGKLSLRKQGKMRWDYTKPAGKVFVSDGKMIYLYTSEDNKVEKIPLKDTEDMRAPLAFLLGHLDLKKEFRDFIVRPESGSTWLEAGAKSAKTPYEKIQMLISADGQISKLNVMGRDASQLQFDLSHEQVNPEVNDSIFAFKIPPGAEVVNAIEYVGEGR